MTRIAFTVFRALRVVLVLGVVTMCLAARSAVEESDPGLSPQQLTLAQAVDALAVDRWKSSDLRLRIVYSLDGEVDDERRPDNGFYGKERISAADLYEQARGSTDPLTLELLVIRCAHQTKTMDRCDRLALAKRWTEADTQNQVAWLALAGILKEQKAHEAARTAFKRAALASTWREHYADAARLVASTIPAGLSAQTKEWALVAALMKAGSADPIYALQTLYGFCKEEDPAMRDACGRIVRVMARDSDTLLSASMAPRYAAKAGLDEETITAYQRTADAFQWSMRQVSATGNFLEVSDDPTAKANIVRLQALIDFGERRRFEQVLSEQRVSESEAARRYVATLSAAQVDRRTAVRRER